MEIDYFRKVRRFFEYASRGQPKDVRRMIKELTNDTKKHMWSKNDPQHLINIKNIYGQTPLYVACKYGNLNIVKLLVERDANVYIKSAIDEENMESNL